MKPSDIADEISAYANTEGGTIVFGMVDNIRTTNFSRNPRMARVLADFGIVKELNEGVKRIYSDMENYFLEAPEYSEPSGQTVKLVLKNNIIARTTRKTDLRKRKWQNIGINWM